jgi:hypothetical protein
MTLTKSTSHRTPAKRGHASEAPAKPRRSTRAEAHIEGGTQDRVSAPAQERPNGSTAATQEEIRALISDAAYLRAQARNFEPGHELDDWYAAEAEIRERLGRGG